MLPTAMLALVLGLGAAASVAQTAPAPDYPIKPIRLIVPFPPGGTNDILGRLLAQRLSQVLHQQVINDNRPGSGGNLGSELASKSVPDGYTLLNGTNGLAISPHLYKSLGYDPLKDLAPVTLFAIVPYVVEITPSVNANNLNDLIALAKARPGGLNFATPGSGSASHLCIELLKLLAGIDLVHVPYKGGAPATLDVLSGRVEVFCAGLPSQLQYLKSGKLRPVAVTMSQRSQFLPDVPTSAEQGLPGLEVNSWAGILAPAKTPKAIIDRLHAEIAKIVATPEMKAQFFNNGAEPMALGPGEFGEFLKAESAKWSRVIKAANITIE